MNFFGEIFFFFFLNCYLCGVIKIMSMFRTFEATINLYKNKTRARRANFIFLTDGSMVYDYNRFESVEDAIIDAVKNHGEDLDDMIAMCYSSTNSYLKEFFNNQINS